MSKGMISYS